MESRTWVLSSTPDGDFPVTFCGTEDEMENEARKLLERFRGSGIDSDLTVWTGYAWMKKQEPYCRIDEEGKHILEASA